MTHDLRLTTYYLRRTTYDFAGYSGQMSELLDKVNPGLKSRVLLLTTYYLLLTTYYLQGQPGAQEPRLRRHRLPRLQPRRRRADRAAAARAEAAHTARADGTRARALHGAARRGAALGQWARRGDLRAPRRRRVRHAPGLGGAPMHAHAGLYRCVWRTYHIYIYMCVWDSEVPCGPVA